MPTSDTAVGATVYVVKRDQDDRFRPHEWIWAGPYTVESITQDSDGFSYTVRQGTRARETYRWADIWQDEYHARKEADRRHNQELRLRLR